MKCSRFIMYLVIITMLAFPTLASAGWWSKYKYYDSTPSDAVYITAEALNFRSCPDTYCHVRGVLHQGDMVKLIKYKGNWAKIRLMNGARGWVSSKYLSSRPVVRYAPEEDSVRTTEPDESAGQKSVTDHVLYLNELTERGESEESPSELLDAGDIFN